MANLPAVLPNKTYQQFVSDMIASWASNVGVQPQLNSGDPLLAIFQAVAGQGVFLEAVILALINLTRAQTSTGADLDTWMAQFNFLRLAASYAQGAVTLATLSVHSTATTVPVGSIIQTTGGAIQYQIIADTTQPAYSASANAYILPANTLSIAATVQALVAGAGSNVQANLLVSFASPIAGIDTVTNALAITNGTNSETDSAFQARFILYLDSLSKATKSAILEAIDSVQAGLDVVLLDNENVTGAFTPGMFTVVVDNGTGNPPSSLLSAVSAAVGAVAGFTIQYNVIGPISTVATISLNVQVATGYIASAVETAVQTAIEGYVNALTIGAALYLSDIVDTAAAIPGVTSVSLPSVLLNGAQTDLVPAATAVIRTTLSDITVGTYSG